VKDPSKNFQNIECKGGIKTPTGSKEDKLSKWNPESQAVRGNRKSHAIGLTIKSEEYSVSKLKKKKKRVD